MINLNERCFSENPVHGPHGPNYGTNSTLCMDISDLMNAHFGQNPNQYREGIVIEHIERFNKYYSVNLSLDINFEKFESEYSELEPEGEFEYKTPQDFELHWNLCLYTPLRSNS